MEEKKPKKFWVNLVIGITIICGGFVAAFLLGKMILNLVYAWNEPNLLYRFSVIGYVVLGIVCSAFVIWKVAPNRKKMKTNWRQFSKVDAFEFVDNLRLEIKGREFNFFSKYKALRSMILTIAIISAGFWIFTGFDSAASQLENFLRAAPQFLMGQITFNEWTNVYRSYYGLEMHWSAFVIYGLMFVGLSYYYERRLGIKYSKNLTYSLGLTLFSIPFFEFFWMASYVVFQNQTWVLRFQMPQLSIILQNIQFLVIGAVIIVYMYADKLKLRFNKVSGLLLIATIAGCLFWMYYPLYVPTVNDGNGVMLSDGTVWFNSNNFPQTLYTVEINVEDNESNGEWFYVNNDAIHGVNTGVKALMTFTIAYIALARKRKRVINEDQ